MKPLILSFEKFCYNLNNGVNIRFYNVHMNLPPKSYFLAWQVLLFEIIRSTFNSS